MPEFAQRIRVSVRTAGRILARGDVNSFLIGGRRLIDDADAYIARCKAAGPQIRTAVCAPKEAEGQAEEIGVCVRRRRVIGP